MRKRYRLKLIPIQEHTYEEPLDLNEEQLELIDLSYMTMLGFAWLLYEKDDCWYIVVKSIADLDKVLIAKVRIASFESKLSMDDLCIDFFETNFDELTKYKILYFTERNRELLLEAFLGKFEATSSEEYERYSKFVIKE